MEKIGDKLGTEVLENREKLRDNSTGSFAASLIKKMCVLLVLYKVGYKNSGCCAVGL